jgi:hypothetical protein
MISKRFAAAAAVLLLTGAMGTGVASAAPKPDLSVTCAGSTTTASWARAKLQQVTFTWMEGDAVLLSVPAPVSPHPPHNSLPAETPEGSTSVTVTFGFADGSSTDVPADCT